MIGLTNMRRRSRQAAMAAAILVLFATVAGCASNPPPEPEAAAAPPAPPPPPPPPPVDLAGRWRFTAVGAGACFMKFGAEPGAAQGTIAPEGGCPGKYFTSRKWTYEHDLLIVRNHKDEPLAQLSFAGGHFQGHEGNLALGLSR
ncbi:MAG TPA: AprI/Inh family metalloprotease inhibitor [Xanthobacteraceae bacterium]|nr:AprI/Inh family metalloprotease inhibitor [Xanthobacteraceae bacterium]